MIGKLAPEFTLPNLSGKLHSLSSYHGRIVVIVFWSAECPWSERADRHLLTLLPGWGDQVAILSIASNDNEPVELLTRVSAERQLPLVLLDHDHIVAKLYQAQTTPHCFVIDHQGILRYQGAFDDVTFHQRIPTRFYVAHAVQALLAGQEPRPAQTDAYGCAILRLGPA